MAARFEGSSPASAVQSKLFFSSSLVDDSNIACSTAEQSSFFDRTKKQQQQKRKSCSSSMPSPVETKGSSPQGGREYSMPPLGHETCAAKVKPCQLAAVTGGSAPQAFLDNVKHNASAGSSFHRVVNFPPAGGIIVRLLCSFTANEQNSLPPVLLESHQRKG